MDTMEKVLHFILIGILLFLGMMIRYILKFNKEIRDTNKRILWSNSWHEFVHWKREMRVYYLCFIPGLTPERVKTIGTFLKYIETQKEKQDKDDGLMKMLFPSLASIFICMLCLMGGTYAWFTASISTPAMKIESASYRVEAMVVLDESPENSLQLANGTYQLESGKTYTVTLQATGTATTGYCVIELTKEKSKGVEKWYTQQFPSKDYLSDTISFTMKVHANATMKFTPQWGTYAIQEGVISNGNSCEYGSTQVASESTHTSLAEEAEQTIQEEIKEAE